MSNQSETKVETLDVNIDELFSGAASASSVTLPDSKPNIFSGKEKVDMSFADPAPKKTDNQQVENQNEKQPETVETETETVNDVVNEVVEETAKESTNDILDTITEVEEVEEKKETRGRKKLEKHFIFKYTPENLP